MKNSAVLPAGRWSEADLKCALPWRLARRHGWANWIPADDLIKAVPTHERGRARDIADDLKIEPYIAYRRNRGFKINNANIDVLADELHADCGYSKFRIEATLSHFGGFD